MEAKKLQEEDTLEKEVRVSAMGKTWILDLDGTIVKHNGYKIDGKDSFLPGAEEFLAAVPEKDMIVFLTSRTDEIKEQTEAFLRENKVRYDHIIYHAPYGERILVNDSKPSGLPMAYALRPGRDVFFEEKFVVDAGL